MTQRYTKIYRWSIWLALLPVNVLAAAPSGTNPLSSMTDIPVQQFVTADNDSSPPPAEVVSPNADTPDPGVPLPQNLAPATVIPVTSNQAEPNLPLSAPVSGTTPLPGTPPSDTGFVQNTPPPPSTNLPLVAPVTPTPVSALPMASEAPGQPVPLAATDEVEVPVPEFTGGIDTQPFIYCSRLSVVTCNRSLNNAAYRSCLSTITQPNCRQFMLFAAKTNFNVGDAVDDIQQYNQGSLSLIHVRRYGINFPGDYYVVGNRGTFYNITSGPEAQAINIRTNPNFPAMQQRFPQAQLWSIVEQPPIAETLQQGGLRLVFRFKILNGCPTCEAAGYANVGYDFTADGMLKQVQLLSLDS